MPDETRGTHAWGAALGLSLTFVALAAWSWGRWTDPQLDFGNELYIAWQLSEGKTLYADIAHRNGPLSHYWNALLFRAFGVSLSTLVWANLAILSACCGLMFALLRRFTGIAGATLAIFGLLTIFAFGQYLDVANYNFVTPYHHFQTHGIALGLLLLLALLRTLEAASNVWPALAGACFGALLLTKLELWLPGLAAALAAVALWFGARRADAWKFALSFIAASIALPSLAFAWLLRSMPAADALRGLLGNLGHVGSELASDAFYLMGAGMDEPWGNAATLVVGSLALALAASAIALVDRALATLSLSRTPTTLIGVALCAGLAASIRPGLWFAAATALPLFAIGCTLFAAIRCLRHRSDAAQLREPAALLLFAVWATALLAKIFLAPRFHHYGFVLAMPATLLLIALWLSALPALARRIGGTGEVARIAAIAIAVAAMLGCLRVSNAIYAHKTLEIGPPGDGMRVDAAIHAPRGKRIEELRQRLAERLPADATLLVYPEGAQLNYWLRRPNPSRYILFLPTELDAFGREEILSDLHSSAPDFVALLQRGHAEFGVGAFGEDPRNGRGIVSWVHDEYELIDRIGPPPFQARGFGAELWQRKDAPSETGAPRAAR